MAWLPVYKEKRVNPIATRKNTRYSCVPAWSNRTARSASKHTTTITSTWYVRCDPTGRHIARTAPHVVHLKLSICSTPPPNPDVSRIDSSVQMQASALLLVCYDWGPAKNWKRLKLWVYFPENDVSEHFLKSVKNYVSLRGSAHLCHLFPFLSSFSFLSSVSFSLCPFPFPLFAWTCDHVSPLFFLEWNERQLWSWVHIVLREETCFRIRRIISFDGTFRFRQHALFTRLFFVFFVLVFFLHRHLCHQPVLFRKLQWNWWTL